MLKYKYPLVIASIVLAVAMPLFGAFKAHKEMRSYPVVKFDIEPYDPRDLLYGHYMTFQINWNWKQNAGKSACEGQDCCLCVGDGDVNPEVSVSQCPKKGETLPACKYIIPGGSYPGFAPEGETADPTFDADINRFYVDERFALPLENLFRDQKEKFSIGLGMKSHGKPVVEKLYVGGKSLTEYAAEHGGTIPVSEPLPLEQ